MKFITSAQAKEANSFSKNSQLSIK